MAEDISQEELTAVRQFVHAFRSAVKMEKVLTIMVTQQEQLGILERRHAAALQKAEEAEGVAARKESDTAIRLRATEAQLSDARRQHADELRRISHDEAEAEKLVNERLREKKAALEKAEAAAVKEYDGRLSALTAAENDKRAILASMEAQIGERQDVIAALEAKKAQMEAEFEKFFKR